MLDMPLYPIAESNTHPLPRGGTDLMPTKAIVKSTFIGKKSKLHQYLVMSYLVLARQLCISQDVIPHGGEQLFSTCSWVYCKLGIKGVELENISNALRHHAEDRLRRSPHRRNCSSPGVRQSKAPHLWVYLRPIRGCPRIGCTAANA